MNDAATERYAKVTLRMAASVATLQAMAHLILFLRSQPSPDSPVWSLAEAMRAQVVTGNTTYWGMYFGYGLLSALTAFFIAALIWVAASHDAGSRKLARLLIAVVLIGVVAHAIVISRYFFVLPLYFDIIVAVLLGFGWPALREPRRT